MTTELRIETFMISCASRESVREATLRDLASSDYTGTVELVLDDELGSTPIERIHRTWVRALDRAAQSTSTFVLILEDDLTFCRWFEHNLCSWPLLTWERSQHAFFASLYNPGRPVVVRRERERYQVAAPGAVWGGQAVVLTPGTARYVASHWHEAPGNPDQKMPRLASRVTPIYFHLPSLVDHREVETTWGGIRHRAIDFDRDWRAPDETEPGALGQA